MTDVEKLGLMCHQDAAEGGERATFNRMAQLISDVEKALEVLHASAPRIDAELTRIESYLGSVPQARTAVGARVAERMQEGLLLYRQAAQNVADALAELNADYCRSAREQLCQGQRTLVATQSAIEQTLEATPLEA